jgi:23S rRNA (cytosine1962-C5)-methyltransferase
MLNTKGERVKIVLKSGKEQSLKRFHPWVFSGAIKKIYGNPAEGDLVDVFDNKDNFLATGHYAPSSIAVRVLSFEQITTDINFFREKIKSAIAYRKSVGIIGNPSINVYRLIHGEGDGLPGLIIDFYNGVAVMQMHSVGFYLIRKEIASILVEIMHDQIIAVYDKSEGTIPHMSSIAGRNEFLYGTSESVVVTENGYKFRIDWTTGQKTGFFIDQRDNRLLLEKYNEGKRVLNMFAYRRIFRLCDEKGQSCTYCRQFIPRN